MPTLFPFKNQKPHKHFKITPEQTHYFKSFCVALALVVFGIGINRLFTPYSEVAASSSLINEYPVPLLDYGLGSITTGPDGKIWFTNANSIGKMNTSGVIKAQYTVNPNNSGVDSIAAGPDGNIWFGYGNGSPNPGIAKLSTSGSTIIRYPAASSGVASTGYIINGPGGELWFTGTDGSGNPIIGSITTSGTIAVYTVPSGVNLNGQITQGSDGNIWFAGSDTSGNGLVGKMTPSGSFTTYSLPSAYPYTGDGIATGSDGNVWIIASDSSGAQYVANVTTSGSFTDYALPSACAGALSISAGPESDVWVGCVNNVNYDSSTFDSVTTSGSITAHALTPGTSLGINDIATDSSGNIWYVDHAGKIGELTP